jgi:hypothetical protein
MLDGFQAMVIFQAKLNPPSWLSFNQLTGADFVRAGLRVFFS